MSLDYHPLSMVLLAKGASGKGWDEPTLLRLWDDALSSDDNRSLGAAIQSVLAAPTIQQLGPAAQDTLEAIAAYPDGVAEIRLGRILSDIGGIGDVLDVLSRFFLVERYDGFVRMLSPFRLHSLRQALTVVPVRENEKNGNNPVEQAEWPPCHTARGGSHPISQYSCMINTTQSSAGVYRRPRNAWEGSHLPHRWRAGPCPSQPH